jgi:hypothetical protein
MFATRRRSAATAALLLLATAALPAAAQERPSRFELTPYGAYRFGGEFEAEDTDDGDTSNDGRDFELHEGNATGLILDIRTNSVNTQWEILYAHQDTQLETEATFTAGAPLLDLDVDYLQFGGTYLFDEASDSTVPFVAMTAGLARFEPEAPGLQAENYFSGSLGGGVQLRADKPIGVRLEARVFGTFVDSDSTLFCRTGPEANFCALSVSGSVLVQFEARAGLVVRF